MSRTTQILAAGLLGLGAAGCVEDIMAPPPPPKEAELVHYWHFNALPEGTLTSATADFSRTGSAVITYPGTGAGYMDRVDPGSDVNAKLATPAGYGLRPRNPANTRELIITAPSTGYTKVVVTFAVQRSSNGPAQEAFYYSADGGTTWVAAISSYDIQLDFTKVTVDLSAVTAVNDNANLRFRILFLGDLATGSSGNNRFDNVAVEAVPKS